ncbi:transcription elongation factor TFIIS-like [Cornus florida]|uniref:transcription elongation factor TFIIS-like n=1 Tax=Cornus florida TaxID=4283 RepID=UPI0028A0D387|nr:transcription elongation factor TFIIS-like [Cornus florida]
MMEKELIELFEAVKKAADVAAVDGGGDSSAEEGRCLDALKRLKKFPVTYEVLVSTQVGKRLRYLTKHPRRRIQALASNLIELWRNIITEETIKNKKTGSLEYKDSVEAKPACAEMIETKTVHEAKSMKVKKVEAVKLEKNDWSGTLNSEKAIKSSVPVASPKLTSVIKCNDALRNKVRELLSEALCKVSGEADEDLRDEVNACDPFRVAVAVESSLFEKWGRSNGTQKFKYRSIMFNIKDPKNTDFRRKVLLGDVKPERIPEMSPEEMASYQRQLENEKIKEKALFECQRDDAPKATTTEFRCRRCGKNNTTYNQAQIRSADEPMTTFVVCVTCNNRWKFC